MWLFSIIGCLLVVNKISTTSTSHQLPQPQHPSPYQFGYTVRVGDSGDYKTHHEVNDGKEVRGVYSLGDPNGDLRVVNYTADATNGFRASVSVHPGASPARARKQLAKPDVKHTQTSQHNTVNTTGETFTYNPTQNESSNLQDDLINNNQTIQSTVKLVNSSLFDVFPGLDKHVPKIELIVEEDYEDSDGVPVYLKNIDLLSKKPQVIPVKVQEDPDDKSLELAESNPEVVSFVKVDNKITSTKPDLQHSSKEGVSFSHTALAANTTTVIDTNNTEVTPSVSQIKSTTTLLPSYDQPQTNFSKILVVKDEQQTAGQNLKHSTEKPLVEDSLVQLLKTIENQNLQQPSTINSPDFVTTEENQIRNEVLDQTVDEFTKTTETKGGIVKPQETVLRPANSMILSALMVPSPPIIKFTCMPDITAESGIKITPILPSIPPSSPNMPQYPARNTPTSNPHGLPALPNAKNTIRTPTITSTAPQHQLNNNRVYPWSGIHFTSNAALFKFPSFTDPYFYSSYNPVTNTPYNPTTSGRSRVDQRKPTASSPTVEITLSPPKSNQSLGDSGNSSRKTLKSILNRHPPLYPIPFPWVYHPKRPFHNYHPQHLPVFVLPMSHNVNFARTFDPQSFDKHNN